MSARHAAAPHWVAGGKRATYSSIDPAAGGFATSRAYSSTTVVAPGRTSASPSGSSPVVTLT